MIREPVRLAVFEMVQRIAGMFAGSWGVGMGLSLLLGGAQRMTSPSFLQMRIIAHAAGLPVHVLWGWPALLLGCYVLATVGVPRAQSFGILGLAMFAAVFAICTAVATLSQPTAALTGLPTYMLVAFMCTLRSMPGLLDWRDRRRP